MLPSRSTGIAPCKEKKRKVDLFYYMGIVLVNLDAFEHFYCFISIVSNSSHFQVLFSSVLHIAYVSECLEVDPKHCYFLKVL